MLLDPGLDPAAKGAEQQAQLGAELERVGGDDQLALDAGALELDDVAGLAFDHGALHLELLFRGFGPLPRSLARLGQAEAMLAVNVDVGHGDGLRAGGRDARA